MRRLHRKGPCEAETGTFGNEITECKWANGECTPTGNRPPSGNALQSPTYKNGGLSFNQDYDLNGKADYVRFEFAESNKLKDLGENFSIDFMVKFYRTDDQQILSLSNPSGGDAIIFELKQKKIRVTYGVHSITGIDMVDDTSVFQFFFYAASSQAPALFSRQIKLDGGVVDRKITNTSGTNSVPVTERNTVVVGAISDGENAAKAEGGNKYFRGDFVYLSITNDRDGEAVEEFYSNWNDGKYPMNGNYDKNTDKYSIISGSLSLDVTDSVIDMSGLRIVGGNLEIFASKAKTVKMPNLEYVGGTLEITFNSDLENLNDFGSSELLVTQDVLIKGNAKLQSIGIDGKSIAADRFTVMDNEGLTSPLTLYGNSFVSALVIKDNKKLQSIVLEATELIEVNIENNPLLETLTMDAKGIVKKLTVKNNVGLNNITANNIDWGKTASFDVDIIGNGLDDMSSFQDFKTFLGGDIVAPHESSDGFSKCISNGLTPPNKGC